MGEEINEKRRHRSGMGNDVTKKDEREKRVRGVCCVFWRDFEGVTEGCRVGNGGLLIYKPVWMAVECLTAFSYRMDNQYDQHFPLSKHTTILS